MKKSWGFFITATILVPLLFIGISVAADRGLIPGDMIDFLLIIIGIPVAIGIVVYVLAISNSGNTFFGGGKEAGRILATGRPATATVLSIDENSGGGVLTINDQPYLNLKLQIDDGKAEPYQISFDTVIARADVPKFQPGAVFPVKIDPNNPQKVTLDPDAPLSTASKFGFGSRSWSDEDRKLLEEKGIVGAAKLAAVEETGKSEDLLLLVKLTWNVAAPGIENYTTTSEVAFPTHSAQQMKTAVGKTFPARLHPLDRTKIKVDVTF